MKVPWPFIAALLCFAHVSEAFVPSSANHALGGLSLTRPLPKRFTFNDRTYSRTGLSRPGNVRASLAGLVFRDVLRCSPLNPTWLIYKLQQALVGPMFVQLFSVVGLSICMIAVGAILFRYVFQLLCQSSTNHEALPQFS